MKFRSLMRGVVAGAVVIGGSSCGSRDDFCRGFPGADADLSRVDSALIDEPFGSVPDARDTITRLVDRLTLLREAAPRGIRGSLGTLLAAYGQVVVAFEGVNFDPQVAASDDAVIGARAALGSSDVVAAREELAAYATDECNVDADTARVGEAMVPTTLPLPSFSPEAAADAPDQGVSEDVLSAVGFVIAETYRIAITLEQASCVGTRAAADETLLADSTPQETHEWTVDAFGTCGITTVPTTVFTSVPGAD